MTVVHFSKNPSGISVGDLLVYYAAVHQKLLGIVEVFKRPEFDARLERWQYFCQVRPRLMIKDIHRAPDVDVLIVSGGRDFRKTVMRMDYAILEDAEYERALEAIEAAFDPAHGDIRDPHFNAVR